MAGNGKSGRKKGGRKAGGKVIDFTDRFGQPAAEPVPVGMDAAQDLIYDAWETPGSKKRVALARKALELWPDCADAYVILAQDEARTVEEAAGYYENAVRAGERALGRNAFKEDAGHFWGLLETRPYMRARAGLAFSLTQMGQKEEAARHYREMLILNPGDNQGIRYELAALLAELEHDEELTDLMAEYEDDGSAAFSYTRALMSFRSEGDSPRSRQLLAAAFESNSHVPRYLLGRKKMPDHYPSTIGFGDESEAVFFTFTFLPGWFVTEGAVQWLREQEAGLNTKGTGGTGAGQKVGRNEPCPCGSGKKYKKCCLQAGPGGVNGSGGKEPGGNGEREAGDLMEEFGEFVEGRSFESLEDLHAEADRYMEVKNTEPVEDFAGLSAEQMHRLLYRAFEPDSPVIFNQDPAIPDGIPLVDLFMPLLSELGEKPLKETATGNLPLKVVKEVSRSYFGPAHRAVRKWHGEFRSEKDFPALHVVRLIATMGGFIKKRYQRFSLTKRGEAVLADGISGEVFLRLLETYTGEFNWGYRDWYPSLPLVQYSAFYTLYLLHRFGGEDRPVSFYEDRFLAAYPMAIDEVEEREYMSREDTVGQCFSLRALDRFAHFFGFMEYASGEPRRSFREKEIVRKTPFLDDWISFKI